MSCIALQRRMPSTIEACTSRSAIMTSLSDRIASKTPAFASMQDGKRIVSSVPRNSVSRCSELAVDVLGAADEADGRHAVAARVEPLVGGLDHLRMAGEAEVVVGAEVDDVLRRRAGGELDLDVGGLGRVDEALLLEEARLPDAVELGLGRTSRGRERDRCSPWSDLHGGEPR